LKRGDIYWARLDPRSGSEQRGLRPVIIVSHDALNSVPTWRTLIVVPCSTSERQARRGPTAVVLAAGTIGPDEESIALCHQITTLDRAKLIKAIGTLSVDQIRAVEAGIRAAVDLEMS
jgi:mRNA interferase MazF